MGLGRGIIPHIEKYPGSIQYFNNISDVIGATAATHVIMEFNVLAHMIPGYITTGVQLFDWFMSIVNSYLEAPSADIKVLVFVSDNYRTVPLEKNAVHLIRAAAAPSALTLEAQQSPGVTDAFCPASKLINISSRLIYSVIAYLIDRLAEVTLHEFERDVYVCLPSQKNDDGTNIVSVLGTNYPSGTNLKISSSDGPLPPPTFPDGEGEINGWRFIEFLREHSPGCSILFCSIDTDNIGIGMLQHPSLRDNVYIQLKSAVHMDRPRQRRIVDCSVFSLVDPRELEKDLLLILASGGSDYVYGVATTAPMPHVGIATIMKHAARYSTHEPFTARTATGEISILPAFYDFLRKFRTPKEIDELAPVLDRVVWNLCYWSQIIYRSACAIPLSLKGN